MTNQQTIKSLINILLDLQHEINVLYVLLLVLVLFIFIVHVLHIVHIQNLTARVKYLETINHFTKCES